MIAHKIPFEIYFARSFNAFRESRSQDEILPSAEKARPTKNDRYRRSRQALKLRNWAKKSHEQMWQADAAKTTSSLGLQQRRKSVYTFDKETNEKTACDGGSYRETKDQVAHL